MKSKISEQAPSITVLLPCYNGARWINETILSVLNQTFDDFEFIIVDDGSIDDSLQIIKKFAETDLRIIVIEKNNTGIADTLNIGILRARGKWIARIDADDVCDFERFKKQFSVAESNPDVVFIGSGLQVIGENGTPQGIYCYPDNHNSLVRRLCTARGFPPHSSAFYRSDVARSLGGYRQRVKRAEDIDLWLRMSEIGILASVHEPLVKIRRHSSQISHDESGRRQMIDSRMAIISHMLRIKNMSDPLDASEDEFSFFFSWLKEQLEAEKLFDYSAFISGVKGRLAAGRASPKKIFDMFGFIFGKPKFFIRWLREWILGESISTRLAVKWRREVAECMVEGTIKEGKNIK